MSDGHLTDDRALNTACIQSPVDFLSLSFISPESSLGLNGHLFSELKAM